MFSQSLSYIARVRLRTRHPMCAPWLNGCNKKKITRQLMNRPFPIREEKKKIINECEYSRFFSSLLYICQVALFI